jgi:hypothetical protein
MTGTRIPEILIPPSPDYFRFSNWGQVGRPTLWHWEEWFRSIGVGTQIRHREEWRATKMTRYRVEESALYRTGRETRWAGVKDGEPVDRGD